MAEPDETGEAPVRKASKLPILIGLILALAGGGGGFFLVYEGLIPLGGHGKAEGHSRSTANIVDMEGIAFVPIEPMIISIGQGSERQHLRFRAELEVNALHKPDVEALMPRVVDVLNGYLRALKISDLETQNGLVRLRTQMLRRVQMVTGQGRINDLLIMEFVMN